jgi:large subunit ribosomal protein L1
MARPKKEESAKKKRLAAVSASIGEPENIFDIEEVAEQVATQETQAAAEGEVAEEKEEKVKRAPKIKGKKIKEARAKVKKDTKYSLDEAITLLKKVSYSKFVGTVELHLTLSDKEVRGTLALPHGSGKNVKVAALVPDAKIKEATEAGADLAGGQEVADKIKSGALAPGRDFNAVVADPSVMPMLAQLAKILGPKGMMPNPKNGTVGPNIGQLVTNLKKGQISYKAEATNTSQVHMPVGKASLDNDKLIENINTVIQTLGANKIKKMYIASTMSPSIEVTL